MIVAFVYCSESMFFVHTAMFVCVRIFDTFCSHYFASLRHLSTFSATQCAIDVASGVSVPCSRLVGLRRAKHKGSWDPNAPSTPHLQFWLRCVRWCFIGGRTRPPFLFVGRETRDRFGTQMVCVMQFTRVVCNGSSLVCQTSLP